MSAQEQEKGFVKHTTGAQIRHGFYSLKTSNCLMEDMMSEPLDDGCEVFPTGKEGTLHKTRYPGPTLTEQCGILGNVQTIPVPFLST